MSNFKRQPARCDIIPIDSRDAILRRVEANRDKERASEEEIERIRDEYPFPKRKGLREWLRVPARLVKSLTSLGVEAWSVWR